MTTTTSKTRLWFNTLFPVACLFVYAYPISRLSNWYNPDYGLNWFYTILIWAAGIGATWYAFSDANMKLRYVVVHWMGVGFIFAVLTLLAEGIRLVVPVSDTVIVQGVLAAGLVCTVVAMLFSHVLAVKQHNINSPKVSRDYRIAHISDVHIGSRQGGFMQRIVNKLNALEPDFIVVTGDLVDSSAVDFLALQSIQQLKARTFFTIGNHERYADLEKIIDIAGRLGMTMLRQESIIIEELMFIGIDDADDKNQVALHLPGIHKDPEKFNVLLYHRPVGWESAIEHGIELKLSGHTHNGQIFPFNLLVKQQFNRISGMYQQGNSRLYVSSGTGTWGPLMRLGSMNEISVFDIKPEQSD
jgi:predicted MPP superfamily phosphohydrolase